MLASMGATEDNALRRLIAGQKPVNVAGRSTGPSRADRDRVRSGPGPLGPLAQRRHAVRMLLKISIPVEKGNEAIKSGALPRTMQSTIEALKPEAAYFFPEEGKRHGLFVFEMEGSWQLPPILEPLFQKLAASG